MAFQQLPLPTKAFVIAVVWLPLGGSVLFHQALEVLNGVEIVRMAEAEHAPDAVMTFGVGLLTLQVAFVAVLALGVIGAGFLLLKRGWARRMLELANWSLAVFWAIAALFALFVGFAQVSLIVGGGFGLVAAVFGWAAVALRDERLREALLRADMRRSGAI